MDFFKEQRIARENSKRLLFLFVLAVICIVFAVNLVAIGASYYYFQDIIFNPRVYLIITLGTVSLIAIATIAKINLLRSQGGLHIAESMGGRQIYRAGTQNPSELQLLNVVEEMSLAAGIPVPTVYVMDGEESINGFAAGNSTSDAVIAVTSGALKQLSREELAALIAHEYGHILSGDMALNIRLMGVLTGILVISLLGTKLMQNARFIKGRK